jgi:transcriptional regulator with XRE-family HTH domain
MNALKMSAFFMRLTQPFRVNIGITGKYLSFKHFDLAGVFPSVNLPVLAGVYMNTGLQIRLVRESRNVTQEYMAARLQISKTSYGNIERNTTKRLTLAMVMAIAEVLQVHYAELLGEGFGGGRVRRRADAWALQAVLEQLHELMVKVDGIAAQLQRGQ